MAKAADSHAWFSQSSQLMAAGNAVMARIDDLIAQEQRSTSSEEKFRLIGMSDSWMHFSAVMLWGYGLENLAKSIIVCKDPGVIKEKNRQVSTPWGKEHGHQLVWLMEAAGVILTNDQRELLNFMTKVTVWGGRYPIPFGNMEKELSLSWNQEKHATLDTLVQSLTETYNELNVLSSQGDSA